jgi:hypothetical protein
VNALGCLVVAVVCIASVVGFKALLRSIAAHPSFEVGDRVSADIGQRAFPTYADWVAGHDDSDAVAADATTPEAFREVLSPGSTLQWVFMDDWMTVVEVRGDALRVSRTEIDGTSREGWISGRHVYNHRLIFNDR